RVDAVDDDPVGEVVRELLERRTVAVPRYGDDDHVAVARVRVRAAGHHARLDPGKRRELGGSLLSALGRARPDADALTRAREPVREAASLWTGAAEDA